MIFAGSTVSVVPIFINGEAVTEAIRFISKRHQVLSSGKCFVFERTTGMSSLLHLTDQRRYHLYRKETDMRKGFDSLCGIVCNELDKRVTDGDAFIFINKPRTHIKLL